MHIYETWFKTRRGYIKEIRLGKLKLGWDHFSIETSIEKETHFEKETCFEKETHFEKETCFEKETLF